MAQTIDFTADSGNRSPAGIRSFVTKHGGIDYHSIVFDELLLAQYFSDESITAADDDVYAFMDVNKGDMILSGFTYVEVAGGVASCDTDWGLTGGDIDVFGTLDPDGTAEDLINEVGTTPFTMLVDDTVDLVVNAQIMIRSVALSTGRWRLGLAIMPVGDMLAKPFLNYAGDPNIPPQG